MSWKDDLDAEVYISTSGDFISQGDRIEFPFTSGGGNGVPSGWTPFDDTGGVAADVDRSVGLGRFNISNASTTSANEGKRYGAYRDFAVIPGHRYIFQVQVRNIEGKSEQGSKRFLQYRINPSGGLNGTYGSAQSEWEQISIPIGIIPAGTTSLTIVLQAMTYREGLILPAIDWGIQFQNLALIDQLASYPPPTWERVTCDVRSLSTRYGRDKFTARYDVASMTLSLLNEDGQFTYRPDTTLRPGRFIKVILTERADPAIQYPHYYGIIDSLGDTYTLDGRAYTTIQAVDISSLLSNQTVPTASWDTNTYYSGARFDRLLDAVGWIQGGFLTDGGLFLQQPVLANGRTVRDELGLIADSEGGYFFADRSGNLVYRQRDWNDEQRSIYVTAELLAQPEPERVIRPPVTTISFVFPGLAGNRMQTPENPSYRISGDTDFRARVTHTALDVGQTYCSKAQFISGTGPNFTEFSFFRNSGNRLTLFAQGNSRNATEDVPIPLNTPHWVRATYEAGTGNRLFFWAPDSDFEPFTWNQLGALVTSPAGGTNPGTAAPMNIGQGADGGVSMATWQPMRGMIHRVILRRGIGGPIVLDLRETDAQVNGQLLVTGTTGEQWRVAQTAGHTVVQGVTIDPPDDEPSLPIVDDIPDLGDPPVICVREVQPSWSRDRVLNEVTLANQGGTAFTTVDEGSRRKYGPRTYQRLDFLNVNERPEYLIQRTTDIMDGYTDSMVRIDRVQFRPTRKDRSYQWAASVFLNQLVRVRYLNSRHGWGFSIVSHVQGIEHSLGLDDWTVALMLDDPEAYNFWETAPVGEGWDVAEWDIDDWDE